MRKNVNKFTDDFKLVVVQDYLSSDISLEELKRKYNFGGNQNIYRWMSKFGVSQEEESEKETPIMSKEEINSTRESELELRIKKLEAELKRAQLQATVLDTMINIAERELKIDIRKKSGAKR